jgi:hypothetical protein
LEMMKCRNYIHYSLHRSPKPSIEITSDGSAPHHRGRSSD